MVILTRQLIVAAVLGVCLAQQSYLPPTNVNGNGVNGNGNGYTNGVNGNGVNGNGNGVNGNGNGYTNGGVNGNGVNGNGGVNGFVDPIVQLSSAIGGGGVAGQDYPILASVPFTAFSCAGQIPGYYADTAPEAGCQVFHICQADGRQDSFLCPNGTVFNQQYFVCDWWYNFDCTTATQFYGLNANIGVVNAYHHTPTSLTKKRFKFRPVLQGHNC
ncbi:hypothetical protein Pmani_003340 [Petrolisthes manimaculis]|uniref:Chitin-binding type-2 domain-containing protein n=1 Tax=Petrolisthes manimaculis TaxID=1843537 RepID=A0AAE1QG06_9EUCA|nr:hypothetical protein Pmani_003340 [Petrolisthes manimaculis]